MIESPGVTAILAMIAIALALMTTARPPRVLLWGGALLMVSAWVPVVVAGLVDPLGEYVGNNIGLGLLAWFGSTLGLIVVVAGLLWQLAITALTRAS